MAKIVILGTVQDGGIPHFRCNCNNCTNASTSNQKRFISSIGIISERKAIIVDATPDITFQYKIFEKYLEDKETEGLLLTHLHIGHCMGLLYFGTEGIASEMFPIYMTKENYLFLLTNKPFSYLLTRKQIEPFILKHETKIYLDGSTTINPFTVEHRSEDGDALGLEIIDNTTNKKAIYISDIDKITEDVVEKIKSANVVIFDGTFYQKDEIERQNNVPHPTMTDTINIFGKQPDNKFYFTHLNHSNPVLNEDSFEYKELRTMNYNVCKEGDVIEF